MFVDAVIVAEIATVGTVIIAEAGNKEVGASTFAFKALTAMDLMFAFVARLIKSMKNT